MFLDRNDGIVGGILRCLSIFRLFVAADVYKFTSAVKRQQRDGHSFPTSPRRNGRWQHHPRNKNKDRNGRKKKPEHTRNSFKLKMCRTCSVRIDDLSSSCLTAEIIPHSTSPNHVGNLSYRPVLSGTPRTY